MRRNFSLLFSLNRRALSVLFMTCLSLTLCSQSLAGPKPTATMELKLKVIHATKVGTDIPANLKKLVEPFAALGFTSYRLTDEISVSLSIGASSRVEMPNGMWMEVRAEELSPNGMLKLEISAKKPKFKTRVKVGAGATIAVGGPPHESGALIFAITRPEKPQR